MLRNKPKAGGRWLQNQVVYGVDVSDQDSSRWTRFGTYVEEQQAKAAKTPQLGVAKSGPPPQ